MKRVIGMSKKNLVCLASMLFISLFFTACDDVFEDDITDDNITISTPLNGTILAGNSVAFPWHSNSGSDDYRVQVSNVSNVIVIDSLVPTNSITFPLTPGEYSWRVRGENFAYQTAYTFPVAFTLEASEVMTDQTVILNSPSDNFYTNTSSGQLVTWVGISTADSYTFELDRDVLGGVSTINQTPGITTTSYSITNADMSTDGIYVWKIKALNTATITETVYSTRKILLDTQLPNIASLGTPLADATESQNTAVVFVWDNGTDSGVVQSSVNSVLELATDIAFTNIDQSYTVATNTAMHTFTTIGDYYWRIKNTDVAGNSSNYSVSRKVTIN